ncbi:MAG: hypothetical protein H0U74_14230 [Bradymonadaceae bacterium]|nr:hypothetical protein [Lujinxingiaceae bacterium]
MGLAIGVGVLADLVNDDPSAAKKIEGELAYINQVISEAGLAPHQEPRQFAEQLITRASLTSFPYSWLHYLRRFAAHVMRDPKWVPYPVEPHEDPASDPVLHQMYRQMVSHLLCHSDSEGYYFPIEFDKIFFDQSHKLRGGALGSSYRLRDELVQLAEALEISLSADGEINGETVRWLSEQRPLGPPFAIERLVWFALFEAARLSIAHNTAIVFH